MKIKDLEFKKITVCCGQHEHAIFEKDNLKIEIYKNKRENGPDNYDIYLKYDNGNQNRKFMLLADELQTVLSEL